MDVMGTLCAQLILQFHSDSFETLKMLEHVHVITKTCPCNIQRIFSVPKTRRGGSNEYPQSMFWSKNKKNGYTPAYPSFAI